MSLVIRLVDREVQDFTMNMGSLHSISILPGLTLVCLPYLYSILYSPGGGEYLEDRLGEDYPLY